ncbi:MAG: nitrilase-related carbon-nitrogen hydrolase [Tepidisphaeraceae bacterium]
MQLVGVQFDIAWENREANHAKVRALLAASPPRAGALVALPEMFSSGFSMNVAKVAEDESRASERLLCETAKRYGIFLVGGVATHGEDGKGRNEAIVAGPEGTVVARYCKLHPFAPGKEKQHYTAGDAVTTFPADGFTVAPFICYDLRFPEIFRTGVQRGANVMLVIANWPSPRVEHWVTLLRARAIENQAYVMGVNRCGNDPYLPYPGRSLIVNFRGDVMADAGARESLVSAEIDLAELEAYRRELPFLADMREDLMPGD